MKTFLLLLTCLLLPAVAIAAEEISIVDTEGQVRFVGSSTKVGSVDLKVANKDGSIPSDFPIKLTRKENDKLYETKVKKGVGSFCDLPAGTYVLSSDQAIVFTDIDAPSSICAAAIPLFGNTSYTKPVLVGVGATAGLTAIGFAIADSKDNDKDSVPLSASN